MYITESVVYTAKQGGNAEIQSLSLFWDEDFFVFTRFLSDLFA